MQACSNSFKNIEGDIESQPQILKDLITDFHASGTTKLQIKIANESNCTKQLPVNAMLFNFSNPSTRLKPYITHGDLGTFFHEFGHTIHTMVVQE